MIINSGNDYIAALKGNQPSLFKDVKTNFTPEFSFEQINKGHGRIEKRHVSICQNLDGIRPWPGLTTLIQVKSERQVFTHNVIEVTTEQGYYISSLNETAQQIAERIIDIGVLRIKSITFGTLPKVKMHPESALHPYLRFLRLLAIFHSIYTETICLKIWHKLNVYVLLG